MNKVPRALHVYSADGLCNRLIVLLSGLALAEASGRAFAMDWQPTATCAASFDQLFSGDWHVRPTDHFDPTQWRDLRSLPPTKFPDLLTASEPVLRIRHHYWLTKPRLYPHHMPLQARACEFFQQLQPIPTIAARVESFRAHNFRPTMLGVHLRRGDFHHTRPDVAGNLEDALSIVDEWIAAAPDAGILLCTDDGAPDPLGNPSPYHGVREQFQARYGSRVVFTTPRSLDRASPESIQDAVQDLWLLRQTQFFVGSSHSTFSDLAALGRAVPIRMAGAPTASHRERQRWLKRTGIYYFLRGLGHLEFGGDVPDWYITRIYKERLHTLRLSLARARSALRVK